MYQKNQFLTDIYLFLAQKYNFHNRLSDIIEKEARQAAKLNLTYLKAKVNPEVIGFKRQTGQVFRVLFYNAIGAVKGDGTVTIKSEETVKDRMDFLKVSISDDGEGIPKESFSRIFELHGLTTSKKRFKMGLAWSLLFMQMCGGDIQVESELGKGTTFHMFIPRDIYKTADNFILGIISS